MGMPCCRAACQKSTKLHYSERQENQRDNPQFFFVVCILLPGTCDMHNNNKGESNLAKKEAGGWHQGLEIFGLEF